jgi:hypothetical protein
MPNRRGCDILCRLAQTRQRSCRPRVLDALEILDRPFRFTRIARGNEAAHPPTGTHRSTLEPPRFQSVACRSLNLENHQISGRWNMISDRPRAIAGWPRMPAGSILLIAATPLLTAGARLLIAARCLLIFAPTRARFAPSILRIAAKYTPTESTNIIADSFRSTAASKFVQSDSIFEPFGSISDISRSVPRPAALRNPHPRPAQITSAPFTLPSASSPGGRDATQEAPSQSDPCCRRRSDPTSHA